MIRDVFGNLYFRSGEVPALAGGRDDCPRVPKTRKQERFALVAVISKFATKSAIALLQVMSATTEASRLGAGRARRAAQNEKDSKQALRISDFDVVVCDCRATGKSFWQRSNSVVAKKIHHGPLQVTKIIK